jgi:hypothetical protein
MKGFEGMLGLAVFIGLFLLIVHFAGCISNPVRFCEQNEIEIAAIKERICLNQARNAEETADCQGIGNIGCIDKN